MHSQEWLYRGLTRTASDTTLGLLLLIACAVALTFGGGLNLGSHARLGPGFFPTIIGMICVLAAFALWFRALLLGGQKQTRWSLKGASIVAAISASVLTAWWWLGDYAPRLDPPDWAAVLVLILAVMFALSRLSRLRAAGLASLAMLLGIVGTDVNTGVQRLTFGVESLVDGFSIEAMLIGFVMADAALSVASPSLLIALYARKFNIRPPERTPDSLLRVAGVIVVAAGLYETDIFSDPAMLLELAFFVVFGLVCQFFDWSRIVFLTAFLIAPLLEESLHRALLLAQGDPAFIWTQPMAVAIVLASVAILGVACFFSARREQEAAQ